MSEKELDSHDDEYLPWLESQIEQECEPMSEMEKLLDSVADEAGVGPLTRAIYTRRLLPLLLAGEKCSENTTWLESGIMAAREWDAAVWQAMEGK